MEIEFVTFVINESVKLTFRSTEVNQGKRQKCCRLLYLWSQVQQDTSSPRSSHSWLFIMYMYVKSKRDANCFLAVKSKDYTFCFVYISREICRLEEGHNLFPLEYRLSAGKISRKHHTNVILQKEINAKLIWDLMFSSSPCKPHSSSSCTSKRTLK